MDSIMRLIAFLILACCSSFPRGEGIGDLKLNYYSKSCPKAEEIVKQEVVKLYNEHGNTAVSWVRNLFHDCMVELGGPYIAMKTGRRDSKQSHADVIDKFIPNHNDSMPLVLSRFKSLGIDAERTVALLGAHSVGRVHCVNLVGRLYPTVDPTIDPEYAKYLLYRCLSPNPDPEAVLYSRNDRETPMIIDNMYYKNLLNHKGLLKVDQQLLSYPATAQFVKLMAADNGHFYEQFAKAMLLMSENNPLTGNEGEVRRDCRFVNAAA